jgi:hypothetical protein
MRSQLMLAFRRKSPSIASNVSFSPACECELVSYFLTCPAELAIHSRRPPPDYSISAELHYPVIRLLVGFQLLDLLVQSLLRIRNVPHQYTFQCFVVSRDVPSQPQSLRGLPSTWRAWRHPVVVRMHLPRPAHGSYFFRQPNISSLSSLRSKGGRRAYLNPVEEAVAPSDLASGAYPRVMAGYKTKKDTHQSGPRDFGRCEADLRRSMRIGGKRSGLERRFGGRTLCVDAWYCVDEE